MFFFVQNFKPVFKLGSDLANRSKILVGTQPDPWTPQLFSHRFLRNNCNIKQSKYVRQCNWEWCVVLGFKGPQFTWRRGVTFERLDRAIGNGVWCRVFPKVIVFHLPRLKPDQRHILLSLNSPKNVQVVWPFQFLAPWVSHLSFA